MHGRGLHTGMLEDKEIFLDSLSAVTFPGWLGCASPVLYTPVSAGQYYTKIEA